MLGGLELIGGHSAVRPLVAAGDTWWSARGGVILRAHAGESPRPIASVSPRARLEGASRWARRVLRLDARTGIALGRDQILVGSRYGIHRVGGVGAVRELEPRPWRALRFDSWSGLPGFDDATAAFGGYGSAPQPVPIWVRDVRGDWAERYAFPAGTIDHVHALVPDHSRACVWILTGDFGNAAALWRAQENFRVVEPVLRGSQQFRSCCAFAHPEGLVYATDSQLEANSLRLLRAKGGGWHSEILGPTLGSAIYGSCFDGDYYFSTAVEPGKPSGRTVIDMLELRRGPGILEHRSALYRVDGRLNLQELSSAKADWLPKRVFQFSTWILPPATGASILPVYAMGLRRVHDQTLLYGARSRRSSS